MNEKNFGSARKPNLILRFYSPAKFPINSKSISIMFPIPSKLKTSLQKLMMSSSNIFLVVFYDPLHKLTNIQIISWRHVTSSSSNFLVIIFSSNLLAYLKSVLWISVWRITLMRYSVYASWLIYFLILMIPSLMMSLFST